MPYVTERWLGGTLTNFGTIRKSLSKLEYLESLEVDGKIEQFSKKEALKLGKEKEKLLKTLGGIRKMDRLPALLFVIDTKKEYNAVRRGEETRDPHHRAHRHQRRPRRGRLPDSRATTTR